ncbi:MAG: 4Fe-4S binding protein [Candidatus Hadarchaeaceae archaeon]
MKACCDVLGNELDPAKDWYNGETKSGAPWVPTFIERIDPQKCIGCGLCVKVCTGNCYELRETEEREVAVTIGGKHVTKLVKRVAMVVNANACLGDCSCHKICPVDGGAIVCKPKLRRK